MSNPYAPPSVDADAPAAQVRSWQRPSLWLAWAEILAGLALGLGGCVESLSIDDSLALVGAAFVFAVGLVALVLPGAILLSGRHPARWLAQPVPLALAVFLVVKLARR